MTEREALEHALEQDRSELRMAFAVAAQGEQALAEPDPDEVEVVGGERPRQQAA